MRICWVTGSRRWGGAESDAAGLARRLASRGHDVAVLARADLDSPLHGMGLRRAPIRHAWWPSLRRALRAAEVAYVTTSAEWVPASLLRPSGTALVLVRPMALELPKPVLRIAAARADAFVAVSDAAESALTRSGVVPPARVRVIPAACRYRPLERNPGIEERLALRRRLGLPENGAIVVFAGGNAPGKGLDAAREAAARLRGRGADVRLVLCGGAPAAAPWETSLGWVEGMDIVFRAADLTIVPTRAALGEGLSLVAIESLSQGTPVVGARVGGIPEAVGPGGRIVDADDPGLLAATVGELLDDAQLRSDLADAGRDHVRRRFDPEVQALRYEALFASVSPPGTSSTT